MSRNPLSIGKIRGLSSTSTSDGVFTILALDHRQSFFKMINPQHAESVSYQAVVEVKSQVVRILSRHASAVLLDPVYGAAQAVANGACPGSLGLIVAVEETGYSGSDIARRSRLLPNWSVAKSRSMGADAVKLLIYYHPDTGELAEAQEQFVSWVVEDCQAQDLPLFLEAVSYSHIAGLSKSSAGFSASLPDLICRIAGRLGALQPEALKLEFPLNPYLNTSQQEWRRACEKVTEAAPCPWVLLSAGVDFEMFLQQVVVACQAGSSGFMAGRAVWQEGIALPNEQRQAWLTTTGAERLERLGEAASRYAFPWQKYYPENPLPEDWYRTYLT